MVGTRGVPARYGGFETCVEEVGARLVGLGHEVTVYCRTGEPGAERPETFLGMRLVHLPALRHRALETLSHTALSVLHLLRHRSDVVLLFNAANSPFLPLLRVAGLPVATHVDGLEWKRAKWSGLGRRFYRFAESWAVRWSDALISDSPGIESYYRREFDAPTVQIAYGTPEVDDAAVVRVRELGLEPKRFHVVVARFEPENHVDVIVEGYVRSRAALPLVVVGSAPYGQQYTDRVHRLADDRVRFLGGVWDAELLGALYGGSLSYLHGHSVGGTNPSLLRAMAGGTSVIAWDVDFNRDVVGDAGLYFRDPDGVARALERTEADEPGTAARAADALVRSKDYDWDDVARRYARLAEDLPGRRRLGRRPSGRRRRGPRR
ncbi:Glycosyltransferase involved in cell wall bisynthesis [Cellulomonas marina]|uniref:Glycosyltransferase involved in cell wall bisynthesis n=2 Tax=Cellulomonas marina TaxID=988821 RepID=A0A1I0X470_9CELL|nr:DUF1972 domain-containing protein [Cellulomonas marina]SFA95721.1 Glycosyltransferase involved in cell wall bisynthesis [Cellulomonas marina]